MDQNRMNKLDNRTYYDEFSQGYDDTRRGGYHGYLDRAALDLLRPHLLSSDVLEIGCGTGRILAGAAKVARRAVGVDISPSMLADARARGLEVYESDALKLPFPDESFNLVYSFKVLAHVENLGGALCEAARVTAPGGVQVLEFYNPYSWRGLIKKLKPASRIARNTVDDQVYTRYDTRADVLAILPPEVQPLEWKGVRILTPAGALHDLPLLGGALRAAERLAERTPLTYFAGFSVLIARKRI